MWTKLKTQNKSFCHFMYFLITLMNVQCHDWRLRRVIRPAGWIGGTSIPQLRPLITNDVTSARWHHLYPGCFSFIFVQREEVETCRPSLYTVYGFYTPTDLRLKNINSNSKCSAMFCSHVSTHTEFTSENKKNILMLLHLPLFLYTNNGNSAQRPQMLV